MTDHAALIVRLLSDCSLARYGECSRLVCHRRKDDGSIVRPIEFIGCAEKLAADALESLIAERDTAIRERDKLRELVTDCQNDLAEYLPPDSRITEHDVVNRLLSRLDGSQARAALSQQEGK